MKKVSPKKGESKPLPDWAVAIRKLRDYLALNQAQFAREFGVTQGAVSMWEAAVREPSRASYSDFWFHGYDTPWAALFWEKSGLTSEKVKGIIGPLKEDLEARLADGKKARRRFVKAGILSSNYPYIIKIPVLSDAVAAGMPSAVEDKDVDNYVYVDIELVRGYGVENLVAIGVHGDSMSPILEDEFIAALSTRQREPSELFGKIVCAVSPDGGVTIRWLRNNGGEPMLVPQQTSLKHPVVLISREPGWRIVGEVIWWIGHPK